MDKTVRRFVRFWTPRSFIADSWDVDVESLDPAKIEWPEEAYAFTLHEQPIVHDGPDTFNGNVTKIGGWYYHPDSKVESLAEVRENPKCTSILISNMKVNHWSHLVWSRWGNWPQPFDPSKDVVLG